MPGEVQHYAETQYGFEWGSAKVERMASWSRKGHGSQVCIGIDTPTNHVQVYVSKTGVVRLFVNGTEFGRQKRVS